MNLIEQINDIFIPNGDDVLKKETFSRFEISYSVSKNILEHLEVASVQRVLSFIEERDDYHLWIKCDVFDTALLLSRRKDIPVFISEIKRELDNIDDELIFFKLEVDKAKGSVISIYDFVAFENYWSEVSVISLLKEFVTLWNDYNHVTFSFLEEGCEEFWSNRVAFAYSAFETSSSSINLVKIREHCHFGNTATYPCEPNDFYLLRRPDNVNLICEKLDLLAEIFCITGIYDITSLEDNHLYYKLNGYKCHSGTIDIDHMDITSLQYYMEIFNWIYSEGNVSDKIGLARNIISIYLKDSIIIPEAVRASIYSGYRTYLQDNLNKYIEIRGKITEELTWISQKSGELADQYLGNYQKNLYAFLTFFLTVFILQVIQSKDIYSLFSKDIVILSYAFLFLSLGFMVSSLIEINRGKRRLLHKYENLKHRYRDLLIEEDINNILQNDEEFNYEMKFIEKRRGQYTLVWIISVGILGGVVSFLANC